MEDFCRKKSTESGEGQSNVSQGDKENNAKKALLEMGFLEHQVVQALEACGKESSIFELSDFIQAHEIDLEGKILGKEHLSESVEINSDCGGEIDVKVALLEMGFPEIQVMHAIEACGKESSIFELSDFIQAHENDLVRENNAGGSKELNFDDLHSAYRNADSWKNIEEKYGAKNIAESSESISPIFIENQVLHLRGKQSVMNDQDVEHVGQTHTKPSARVEECSPDEAQVVSDLLEMGFSKIHVYSAIEKCGKGSSMFELTDFIHAQLIADEEEGHNNACITHSSSNEIRTRVSRSGHPLSWVDKAGDVKLEKIWDEWEESDTLDEATEHSMLSTPRTRKDKLKARLTNSERRGSCVRKIQCIVPSRIDVGSMNGFGVPGNFLPSQVRSLDIQMVRAPFFYFENVVSSRSAWSTIQRHFHGIDPEFVDSKYFSCAKRERGYVHNLPIEGREVIIPEPPLTIKDAFPEKSPYWPLWDTRKKLECITKKRVSEKTCRAIREKIEQYRGMEIPLLEQQEIISTCKEYNLIWVAPGEVANLEPNEMEMALGFDHDHTRGSFTMKERLESLENAFQVNTIAYHLSPLKRMFPNGIRVLSLFAGVGGAEVALHKIGISLRHVVCVEIKEKCRNVVEIWWKKTNQSGNIIFKNDVQDLTYDALSSIFEEIGGFDLVIGGSPCSDPSGEQREEDCRLFYEFPRIFNIVKHLTSKGQ